MFSQDLFKRWINNKLKVILVIFTSYFLSYSIVLCYKRFNKTLWDRVGATLTKYVVSPMPKLSDNSCLQENQEQCATCTFLCPIKLMLLWINNFFSPLSWNNPLSEILGELYKLTNYRHLDAEESTPWMLREFITCNFMKKITHFKYIFSFSTEFLKLHSCQYQKYDIFSFAKKMY